jgi:hypothetical protein
MIPQPLYLTRHSVSVCLFCRASRNAYRMPTDVHSSSPLIGYPVPELCRQPQHGRPLTSSALGCLMRGLKRPFQMGSECAFGCESRAAFWLRLARSLFRLTPVARYPQASANEERPCSCIRTSSNDVCVRECGRSAYHPEMLIVCLGKFTFRPGPATFS